MIRALVDSAGPLEELGADRRLGSASGKNASSAREVLLGAEEDFEARSRIAAQLEAKAAAWQRSAPALNREEARGGMVDKRDRRAPQGGSPSAARISPG